MAVDNRERIALDRRHDALRQKERVLGLAAMGRAEWKQT